MTTLYRKIIPSPIGELYCYADDNAVRAIYFQDEKQQKFAEACKNLDDTNILLDDLASQLNKYFAGELKVFDIPVYFNDTSHRNSVWEELKRVNYGEIVTYKEIAQTIGSAAIAVGQAVGANPISIVLPCHRVLGSNNKLTGYAGGLERKEFLLKLEGIL